MPLDAPVAAPFSLETLGPAFAVALGEDDAGPSPAQKAFLARVLGDFRPGELPNVRLADLAEVLAGFWRFGAEVDGSPAVRLRRASGAHERDLGVDVLEIAQPDAPFLVDSVMGEVGDAGVEVKAMFHPMVGEGEARVSMIQVWLAPVGEDRRASLIERVLGAIADVRAAVADFPAMMALMDKVIADLEADAPRARPAIDPAVLAEDLAFLRWVNAGHFVFLGARTYDYPRTPDGGYAAEEPSFAPDGSLGLLRDPARLVLRRVNEPAVLAASIRRRLETAAPVVVAKSNLRSRVHRRVYMDYVGVRRFGAGGEPIGETRFVGLFTAQAYDQPAIEIPMLRRKIDQVMAAAGFASGSHNAIRLANILETYPRDELFQIDAGELLTTALDILHLFDRPKVKLFARYDPFDRFVSVMLFAPRERYDDHLRQRAGALLAEAFGGRVTAYYPSYSDAPLARVHYIIGLTPGAHPRPDLATLEGEMTRLARTWGDDLEATVRAELSDPADAPRLLAAWREAFPAGYCDRYDAGDALYDILAVEALAGEGAVSVRAFRSAGDTPRQFHFKLYRKGADPAPLSRVLPILADMGLSALVEDGFPIRPRGPSGARSCVWVHEFLIDDENGERLSFEAMKAPFEAAFQAVWNGRAECDGFNRLVLELGVSWRDAALIRALARYRRQSGLDPSEVVQTAALSSHPNVARLILDLFAVRFDPATGASLDERRQEAARINGAIEEALQGVENLDDDRVLRRLAALVMAITRTNVYQTRQGGARKPYISFKLASRELTFLPEPKPFREIFVAAPNVEGVHLRMGPVARGGLRWSDRRDDFRTEVLGLVKAQQVKNAVIVPVGSKGGFYPKLLPRGAPPEAIRTEAVAAYKTFLDGLLDLTDTIDAEGKVVHPAKVVVHDGEDPYLVVAADKGTATFSDIANGVAEAYGFWLGDAFASGGSAGYDHKAMGITARGAWESVKRHFRELGVDVQTDPVTVIGVGDMSGDVFGNGMLLSKTIRLRAAFDHRHIFLDPNPNAATAWAERKRLFDLPTSSWDSYDRALISKGGGVYPRTLKSIPLSAEVKALLDLKADALTPAELIVAILKSRAELLYLGGIGTYVKGASEANLVVGDKANDLVRINGRDLRCRVVGEGANLGFTQAGRIEFALAGGRINTDAIDNSAGVDTSDHEVNIKILTGMAERAGELARADRNALLASMTDAVASHVLVHNYDQNLALSLMEADAPAEMDAQEQFMARLESQDRLDRELEGLPDAEGMAARAGTSKGLTRPELAVLLAYGKLDLAEDIVASTAPDDPYFVALLEAYFPEALLPYRDQMKRHRLRREIIATVVDNDLVNLCGPTFPGRLREAAGCDTAELITAFEAARQVLRFEEAWARVERLDGETPAAAQIALFAELVRALRGQTYWLARRAGRGAAKGASPIQGLIDAYRPAVDALREIVPAALSTFERKAAVRRADGWMKAGAPKDVAHAVAVIRPLTLAAPLADLAQAQAWPLAPTAFVYHRVGGAFGFDKLRAAASTRGGDDPFERLAVRRLIEDMIVQQTALAGQTMAFAGGPPREGETERAVAAVTAWTSAHTGRVKAARRIIDDVEKAPGGWTFAKLTIANGALRELAGG
jgi:glutamate dehydrogenase